MLVTLTIKLCNFGERWIFPDNHIVLDISMSRDKLFVVRRKRQCGHLKDRPTFFKGPLMHDMSSGRIDGCGGSYLGQSVQCTDTGATVDIPDANVSVTGAATSGKNVWLPWAPGQSLRHPGQGISHELDISKCQIKTQCFNMSQEGRC